MFYGVAYYPEHWPEENWTEDAKNIRECGMDGVRIGEFAWSRMEPKEGEFDFEWLDKAIKILGEAGLKVIIGTPTATPPSWLVHKHPEILPVDGNGMQMKNGVRKYYCHSNEVYRQYAKIIATKLAQRYGTNPHVVGWQIDNEFGDHDTIRCYCTSCHETFINWCKTKFSSLDELNSSWGTVFWSQEYSTWEQIDLPYPRKEIGLNPSHLLDYYRFASDQVVEFCENQVSAIRKYISKEQWITTNLIATYWEIDFKKLARRLDFISWDCYTVIDATSPIRKPKNAPSPPVVFPPRPEMVSLVHDMMRSFSDKPFWVMETAGQDRLVSYHTMAHGGGGVNFFRWKGPRFGAEQGRGGYEHHGIFSNRFRDGKQISDELHQISDLVSKTEFSGQVGLLYSFDMGWAYDIGHVYPRSIWIDGVGYWRLMEEYYTAFWKKNINVQPMGIDDDLSACPVLVVPCLYLTTPKINEALRDYVKEGGTLIVGPASGTKDWNNVYLENLPPDEELKDIFGCELVGTGGIGFFGNTMNVNLTKDAPFGSGQDFSCKMKSTKEVGFFSSTRPAEILRSTTAKVFGYFPTNDAACTINKYGKGRAIYLGFSPGDKFMSAMIEWLISEEKLSPLMETPSKVEATIRKGVGTELTFIINHNFAPATVSLDAIYKDIVQDRMLQDDVVVEPQHTLILEKLEN
jgi:beta-galactosidase